MAVACSRTTINQAQRVASRALGDPADEHADEQAGGALRRANLLSMHAIFHDLANQLQALQIDSRSSVPPMGNPKQSTGPGGDPGSTTRSRVPEDLPIQTVIMDEAACSTDWSTPMLLAFHPYNLVCRSFATLTGDPSGSDVQRACCRGFCPCGTR